MICNRESERPRIRCRKRQHSSRREVDIVIHESVKWPNIRRDFRWREGEVTHLFTSGLVLQRAVITNQQPAGRPLRNTRRTKVQTQPKSCERKSQSPRRRRSRTLEETDGGRGWEWEWEWKWTSRCGLVEDKGREVGREDWVGVWVTGCERQAGSPWELGGASEEPASPDFDTPNG